MRFRFSFIQRRLRRNEAQLACSMANLPISSQTLRRVLICMERHVSPPKEQTHEPKLMVLTRLAGYALRQSCFRPRLSYVWASAFRESRFSSHLASISPLLQTSVVAKSSIELMPLKNNIGVVGAEPTLPVLMLGIDITDRLHDIIADTHIQTIRDRA